MKISENHFSINSKAILSLAMLIFFSTFQIHAQHVCLNDHTDDYDEQSSTYQYQSTANSTCFNNNLHNNPDRYRLQQNFIPDTNTPIKTIRLNIHVIQESAANPRNFEDVPDDRAFLKDIEDHINFLLENLALPAEPKTCVCGTECYIKDSRIRVEVQDIYFYVSASLYSSRSFFSLHNAFGSNLEDNTLNFYITGEDNQTVTGGRAEPPSYNNFGHIQSAIFEGYYTGYAAAKANGDPEYGWGRKGRGANMFHELGHNLSLRHLYTQTGFVESTNTQSEDYLDEFLGAGTSSCPQITLPLPEFCTFGPNDACSVNWMGGNGDPDYREATPKQLGRAHRT